METTNVYDVNMCSNEFCGVIHVCANTLEGAYMKAKEYMRETGRDNLLDIRSVSRALDKVVI